VNYTVELPRRRQLVRIWSDARVRRDLARSRLSHRRSDSARAVSNMKMIIFGSTGMVGQGVLRECLRDPDIDHVLTIVRSPIDRRHAKLHELLHRDFFDFSSIEAQLSGYDACLFCLGASSFGMDEARYERITYGIALAAAHVVLAQNPALAFIYVSGAGADSSERGRAMWARIKGRTENALLKLPFRAIYILRPGFIQPRHGIQSRTFLHRLLYRVLDPFFPLLRMLAPGLVTNTEQLGRAIIETAKGRARKQILENRDICDI
jgi:uncharacterized protein YbjT (DUF2867 family)